jgi:hypothetical protein
MIICRSRMKMTDGAARKFQWRFNKTVCRHETNMHLSPQRGARQGPRLLLLGWLTGWLAVRQLLLLLARCLMIFSVYEYLNGAHEYGLKRARAHY